MKSKSVPNCPDCRNPMRRTSDGNWTCENGCAGITQLQSERRDRCVRVLVTQTMFRQITEAADGKPLSSWGYECFKRALGNEA